MIHEIKELYDLIDDKKAFCEGIAPEFKISSRSIYTNWFSSFWSIPDKHMTRVLELLKDSTGKITTTHE